MCHEKFIHFSLYNKICPTFLTVGGETFLSKFEFSVSTHSGATSSERSFLSLVLLLGGRWLEIVTDVEFR